jgi:hypothetical protein
MANPDHIIAVAVFVAMAILILAPRRTHPVSLKEQIASLKAKLAALQARAEVVEAKVATEEDLIELEQLGMLIDNTLRPTEIPPA